MKFYFKPIDENDVKKSFVTRAIEKDIDYYPYKEDNGLIVKVTGSGKNIKCTTVISGIIFDYRIYRNIENPNYCEQHQILLEANNKKYYYTGDSTEAVRDWLYEHNFIWNKKATLDFLKHTLMILREESRIELTTKEYDNMFNTH